MTEKDLEIQELKAEIKELRTKLGQYQEGLNWTRDRLVETDNMLDVCKSDLYKAVVYDCRCSLCAKMSNCVKSDNELTQYNCFKWRREK